MKVPANIYCYAICHNETERWYAPTYASDMLDDECLVAPWHDDLNVANVYHAADVEAEGWDIEPLPQRDGVDVAHWVALTWDDYARLCGIEEHAE